MSRIKIDDLPQGEKISRDVMKRVMGGVEPTTFPLINPTTLPFINTGKLAQGIAGVNFNIQNPIQYFPGSHWKT